MAHGGLLGAVLAPAGTARSSALGSAAVGTQHPRGIRSTGIATEGSLGKLCSHPQTQRHPVHGVHGTAERSTAGEPKHGGAVRRAGQGVVVRRGQLEALHEQVAGHGAGSQGDGGHGDCWEMCARTCRHSAIRCTGVGVRVGRTAAGARGRSTTGRPRSRRTVGTVGSAGRAGGSATQRDRRAMGDARGSPGKAVLGPAGAGRSSEWGSAAEIRGADHRLRSSPHQLTKPHSLSVQEHGGRVVSAV